MSVKLEVCVDSVESAIAAQKGGADRVELCANLLEGGTTPSAGMIRQVREQIQIGLQVMIRSRGSDFLYSHEEFQVMKADIEIAKNLGADGVVFGCLTPEGAIDKIKTADLIGHAQPLNVTFHRAFDMVKDRKQALEDLIELKIDRVLTSGLAPNVMDGVVTLANIVRQAKDRIIILAGGGVRDFNARELIERTGVPEIHMSGRKPVASKMKYRRDHLMMGALPDCEYLTKVTDEHIVRAVKAIIQMPV
ncbi:MAG: copper homeostasis protein CutC [Marinoscillum sp.]